ncbi:MAG: hypothetical protein WCO86_19365 [Planctomycetota bacterium]
MIPSQVVETLIEIGNGCEGPVLSELSAKLDSLQRYDEINREHWSAWDQVTGAMPLDRLIGLAKGLTLAEDFLNWAGGSVAAVIWVFREIQKRDDKRANEVADWILPRTQNPYVPFGRLNFRARTSDEYHRSRQWRSDYIAARLVEENQIVMRVRAERTVRQQKRQWASQNRRSELRTLFRVELKQKTITEQLLQFADDQVYAPEFYPTCLADAATPELIHSLDDATILKIVTRLKGPRRGPWKNLKQRLLSKLSEVPWDQEKW